MKRHPGRLVALFDLDGTLVNTDKANSVAYRKVLAKSGFGSVPGLSGRITMQTILKNIDGLSKTDARKIALAKAEEYCKVLWNSDLGPAAEALRMVIAGRDLFSKVVLLTDSQERRALETLRFHGLDSCFDEIVCNEGSGDKYLNYFKCHDANPAVTIVWENDKQEISSAVKAGVNIKNIKKVGK